MHYKWALEYFENVKANRLARAEQWRKQGRPEKAVSHQVEFLYKDDGEFNKNRYRTERTFEPLNSQDVADIANEIIDYLTN